MKRRLLITFLTVSILALNLTYLFLLPPLEFLPFKDSVTPFIQGDQRNESSSSIVKQSFLTNEEIPQETNIPIKNPVTKITQEDYLELKEFSEHYHYDNGTIAFSSRLGDQNTWDGSEYQYYIWDDIEKSVQFANSKLIFYDWYAIIEQFDEVVVDDSRWIVEYWREQGGGSWRTLDLYNHVWFDPIISTKEIVFIQGYNDDVNYMNVSYVVTNNARVKINIDYFSGEIREVRFVWQLTGMDGNINYNATRRDFSFADIIISCNDTEVSTGFEYSWVVDSKKLDVYLGSFLVDNNDLIVIDPSFSEKMETDALDIWGQEYLGAYDCPDNYDAVYVGAIASKNYRFTIAWDTEITDIIDTTSDAEFTFYVDYENLEVDEYFLFGLYDKGDVDELWNESEAMAANETWWNQELYWSDASFWSPQSAGNLTISDAKTGTLIDEWVSHHNDASSSRQFIPIFVQSGTGIDTGGEDDRNKIHESSHATVANRPTLTFTYTLGGNNAPNAPTLETDSGNTFAGKFFIIETNHTDDDGGVDIETMYLQQYYSGYNITIYCFQNASSGSVTVLVGSGYLDGTPTYSHSGITDGYQVTWNITFDWDFIDDTAYITYARTVDDEPEWSSWANLDADNLFENDLECETFNVYIDGKYEYGGSNAKIEDTDWFKGGKEVTCNGTVEYEGSSQTFDSVYAAAIEVELIFDEGDTSEVDSSISSGVFSGIIYTPTDSAGIDTTAYFDVKINNIPSDGSDVTGAGIEITSKRDNENPTTSFHSITENNPHTYIYITGQTVYFSDNMGATDQLFTIAVNVSDGSGSGIYAVEMSAWDDDAIQNDTTDPYERQYSVDSSETSGSITFHAIDNVGNEDQTPVTITMTEDLTAPTATLSLDADSASIGYDPNTNYDDDSTVDFTVSDGSDGGSGLPANCYSWNSSAFESSTTKQYGGMDDGNISLNLIITDNVGNNGSYDTWVIIDTDSPESFTITWTRVNGTYPIYVDMTNTTIFFDPGNECNNYTTITVNDDGTIQNSDFWKIEWDKNSVFETAANDTSGLPDNKNFYYQGDTNGTFIIRIINNAGNYQTFNYSAYDTLDGGCGVPPSTGPSPSFQNSTIFNSDQYVINMLNSWGLFLYQSIFGALLISACIIIVIKLLYR